MPYEANQVEITIVKAKPKIVGKLGSVTLYYDKFMNRYYEKDAMGNKVFAGPDPNAVKEVELPTPSQEELEF
jgi:hypothetical protein